MPQEAHDELRGDAVFLLCFPNSHKQAVDRDSERQAAIGMRFGIEKDFGVLAAISMEPGEVGEREIAEVFLRLQDVRSLVVDVEEVLEVGEGVGLAYFFDRL